MYKKRKRYTYGGVGALGPLLEGLSVGLWFTSVKLGFACVELEYIRLAAFDILILTLAKKAPFVAVDWTIIACVVSFHVGTGEHMVAGVDGAFIRSAGVGVPGDVRYIAQSASWSSSK
jgi:hypothetical protein